MHKGEIKISDLGFNIKERRIERGLSQVSVARDCGVSCTAIQRWENGTAKFIKNEHSNKLREILNGDETKN